MMAMFIVLILVYTYVKAFQYVHVICSLLYAKSYLNKTVHQKTSPATPISTG